MTAKASVVVLQGRPGMAFQRLFMTRTTLWRKCDAFVQARKKKDVAALRRTQALQAVVGFFLFVLLLSLFGC